MHTYPRYGESIASVMAGDGDREQRGLPANSCSGCCRQAPPRNAIDCALWDLQARREGKTLPSCWAGVADRVITASGGHWHAGSDGGQRRGAVAGKGPAVEGEARRSTDQ